MEQKELLDVKLPRECKCNLSQVVAQSSSEQQIPSHAGEKAVCSKEPGNHKEDRPLEMSEESSEVDHQSGEIAEKKTKGEEKGALEEGGNLDAEEGEIEEEASERIRSAAVPDGSVALEGDRLVYKDRLEDLSPSRVLHVRNVGPNISSDDLREFFERYGVVVRTLVFKNQGLVQMESLEVSKELVNHFNLVDFPYFRDRRLYVGYSRRQMIDNGGDGKSKNKKGKRKRGGKKVRERKKRMEEERKRKEQEEWERKYGGGSNTERKKRARDPHDYYGPGPEDDELPSEDSGSSKSLPNESGRLPGQRRSQQGSERRRRSSFETHGDCYSEDERRSQQSLRRRSHSSLETHDVGYSDEEQRSQQGFRRRHRPSFDTHDDEYYSDEEQQGDDLGGSPCNSRDGSRERRRQRPRLEEESPARGSRSRSRSLSSSSLKKRPDANNSVEDMSLNPQSEYCSRNSNSTKHGRLSSSRASMGENQKEHQKQKENRKVVNEEHPLSNSSERPQRRKQSEGDRTLYNEEFFADSPGRRRGRKHSESERSLYDEESFARSPKLYRRKYSEGSASNEEFSRRSPERRRRRRSGDRIGMEDFQRYPPTHNRRRDREEHAVSSASSGTRNRDGHFSSDDIPIRRKRGQERSRSRSGARERRRRTHLRHRARDADERAGRSHRHRKLSDLEAKPKSRRRRQSVESQDSQQSPTWFQRWRAASAESQRSGHSQRSLSPNRNVCPPGLSEEEYVSQLLQQCKTRKAKEQTERPVETAKPRSPAQLHAQSPTSAERDKCRESNGDTFGAQKETSLVESSADNVRLHEQFQSPKDSRVFEDVKMKQEEGTCDSMQTEEGLDNLNRNRGSTKEFPSLESLAGNGKLQEESQAPMNTQALENVKIKQENDVGNSRQEADEFEDPNMNRDEESSKESSKRDQQQALSLKSSTDSKNVQEETNSLQKSQVEEDAGIKKNKGDPVAEVKEKLEDSNRSREPSGSEESESLSEQMTPSTAVTKIEVNISPAAKVRTDNLFLQKDPASRKVETDGSANLVNKKDKAKKSNTNVELKKSSTEESDFEDESNPTQVVIKTPSKDSTSNKAAFVSNASKYDSLYAWSSSDEEDSS